MTTESTRWQLLGGVVAAPLFFVVALAQAFTRPGFDLTRHFLSQLSAGEVGWIQMANFIVVGVLYVLCASAMSRVLAPGRGATWGPRLLGMFGVGLMAAGVFVADPANGYPAGPPLAEASWHGIAHGVAALASGLALTAGMFVFAARFVAEKRMGWAIATAATAVIYFVLPWTNVALSSLLLVIASVLGWGWVSVIAWRLSAQLSSALQSGTAHTQPA